MKSFSIKKENIIISLTLLLIFLLSINHHQDKVVVGLLAYLFLISVVPILVTLFLVILNNVINTPIKYNNDYTTNIEKLTFDWSCYSTNKLRSSYCFSKIDNAIYINQSNTMAHQFLNHLLEIDKETTLKLIFIDYNGVNLFINENKNNLLCRVFTKKDDLSTLFNKIINEIEHRYDLLVKKDVKNYIDYNKISRDLKEVLLVINEVEEIINDQELCNYLIRILMRGKDVGIKVVLFSCLKEDNIKLNRFNTLLSIQDSLDIKLLTER